MRYLATHSLLLTLLLLTSSPVQAQEAAELKTGKEKVSYGFGLNVGRSMVRDGLRADDLDLNLIVAGLRDALMEKPLGLTEEEFQAAYKEVIIPKLMQRAKMAAEQAKKEGDAFLAANKKKPGVKVTASGLQYRVLKEGAGKSPKATDVVRVQYTGSLVDGSVFDQSQQPIELPLTRVIKGWNEGLQLMKEGGKYQFVIPPDLAYGEKGYPPEAPLPPIPGHSVLVFEVELVGVGAEELDEIKPPKP